MSYQIGDPFPLETVEVGDCPAIYVRTQITVPAMCILDQGHEPPHVAVGEELLVVAVWDEEVEVWE